MRIPGTGIALESSIRFLGLGLALILENPIHVLLTIKRHADLPRLGEDLRILDGNFVLNGVGVQ